MSQFQASKQEPSGSDDDDWITPDVQVIDALWMQRLFPDKAVEKTQKWLQVLHDNEFETLEDLKLVTSEDWKTLALPLAVETKIRNAIATHSRVESAVPDGEKEQPERPVSQIDIVVVDISASMRSRSTLDVDKTREDVSKMLFHTLIDKLLCLELYHAVGLLAFGQKLHPYTITRDYEQFHDFLGRLDANEGGTMLYDSIYNAAEIIETYASENPVDATHERKKRIFVLTDGDDNRSKLAPWHVAQFLQQRNIQLDAIPVAAYNPILQSMCTATGGLCFRANSQEQAISLFEREATLHLAYREVSDKELKPIVDIASLKALEEPVTSSSAAVTEIRSAVPSSVHKPVLKTEDIAKATATSRGATKRILREYRDFQNSPVPGWSVYINADNTSSWKAVLNDGSIPAPYSGGMWLVTIDFPSDYPFKPPKIIFVTPIYHCNISCNGGICLDILKDSWNPALTVSKALQCISAMLLNPNPDDPLDAFKGQLYRDDRAAYMRAAELHTQKHACVGDEVIAKLLGGTNL